jgi:hypothetical protein
LVFKKLNPHSKLRYKAFLLNVAKAWATDETVAAEPAADTVPRKPKFDPPGQLSGDMRIRTLVKIVKSGHSKRKHPTRQCRVCAVHKKRSETAYICKFCIMPLHRGECFEKYHTQEILY